MHFKVAIIGRPNIGKSSLFNRILNKKWSIVDEKSGTTKDRIYAQVTWLNQFFFIIDTGGIDIENIPLTQKIKQQSEIAIKEAHLIVFMVDGQMQLTSEDLLIAKLLYASNKKVIVAVNKIDNMVLSDNVHQFYALGFKDVIGISAQHGIGIGELLDNIILHRQHHTTLIEENRNCKFALIGRPNVGKSTFTNALLAQERMIVSDMPGTTTDAVDTFFCKNGKHYQIIDTAGLKKRGQLYEKHEKYIFLRTLNAIERSDIVCFVLDASQPIMEQDRHIAALLFNKKKSCIIIYNKWDLVESQNKNIKKWKEKTHLEFKFLTYAPILFVSSQIKQKIKNFFLILEKVSLYYRKTFSSHLLNDILNEAVQINPPGFFNHGKVRFYYLKQINNSPPVFLCLVNNPQWIHFSYERFLKNQLRLYLELTGIPLQIIFQKKEKNFL
ncbi:ribosome biogenesis GTPase Der [Candidatus Phytoplasma phoenicium]|uniref:GTPase Der n=1 Tax=Candidatus Phytoplasma phoenicium TaxID=198422 RepID=A0A0L0MKS5_9MOLU|nr:ribosome biogenesis GTPase Der [Candidatus Phytoplasma phoenicium]KND62584.1 GTP-binding protein EngA [Candidatus Phytoplasma phoenicium]